MLLDGHRTHYHRQAMHFAMEPSITMLCMAPYTTHKSKSLDVGVLAPLKTQWTQVCHNFYQKSPGRIIMNFNFSHL